MKVSQQDLEMADDVYGAMLTEVPSLHRLTIWAMAALLFCFLIWSYFSELQQVTSGMGKVIPSTQVQIIQSLDGGVLQKLFVQEGMQVIKGQPIASIDDTRFRSDFAEQKQEVSSLRANVIRLRAELSSILIGVSESWQRQIEINIKVPVYPDDLQQNAKFMVERQQEEYSGRIDNLINQLAIQAQQIQQREQEVAELVSKINTLKISYEIASKELDLTRPLAEKNIVSKIELYKLERSVNELKGELSAVRLLAPKLKSAIQESILNRRETALAYRTEARSELNELENKLSRINESQVGAQDKVTKALILSPVIGTIKTIHINTLGGVVKPGETIAEIVPTEDKLMVEAKIKPRDIAFIYPGLPAVVKITAYDFTRYGGLTGKVEHISADTTQDEEGNSFYLIRVRTDASSIKNKNGKEMPIIPGMLTDVDVITGKRTILEYILNPILRANEAALRER
ncbi:MULTISPECIES: HlyD family type I secretion periplasmic adaptor subunit [unclassified Colwellia]|jgi:adhesin transport system membrane fusion protein|uniref:HlyD family type I secretion periplasmic adaptor subunit n=1 Tax=unclassified Colwellia TaxID=196834 RepID=UPI0015F5BF63|nr:MULTISPECIES: HlyD family type I secretion periplasmic adaptor subunit [unclassified Colwellia]MBA6364110.1 HlyD family type I secretion periplasmic adaptor subunit [Colwellia sp. BRX8-8]MBA6371145.1 HlyD family type I secretion periplasmic adaptor subunit [Colwellia sp. BRX8-4]MBA6381033.1 HlyD family type I secretion periplasmic adaptor subunit [Colwellia sp. BRX10-7]MBA6388655.1 HlyD family type I secretion periplasmic adaptor subunit [Colwellia sp. BRX10-2]MBA6403500.1 HlyD family type 